MEDSSYKGDRLGHVRRVHREARSGVESTESQLKRVRQDFEARRIAKIERFFHAWPSALIAFLCEWLDPPAFDATTTTAKPFDCHAHSAEAPSPVTAVIQGRDSGSLFNNLVMQHCRRHRPTSLLLFDWCELEGSSPWEEVRLPLQKQQQLAKEVLKLDTIPEAILFVLDKQSDWALAQACNRRVCQDVIVNGGEQMVAGYNDPSRRDDAWTNHIVMVLDMSATDSPLMNRFSSYLSRWLNVAVFLHCPTDIRKVGGIEEERQQKLWKGVDNVYIPLLRPLHLLEDDDDDDDDSGNDEDMKPPPSEIDYKWIESALQEWQLTSSKSAVGALFQEHGLHIEVVSPGPNRYALCFTNRERLAFLDACDVRLYQWTTLT